MYSKMKRTAADNHFTSDNNFIFIILFKVNYQQISKINIVFILWYF